MGKMEKNGKKIMQLKWPKYQKPKDENMGWTRLERNNNLLWVWCENRKESEIK